MAGGCAASPDPDVVELLFTARENVPATTAATSRMTMILKMVFIEYSFSFQLLFAGKLGRACASRPPALPLLLAFFDSHGLSSQHLRQSASLEQITNWVQNVAADIGKDPFPMQREVDSEQN